jgi:hypothetical protein
MNAFRWIVVTYEQYFLSHVTDSVAVNSVMLVETRLFVEVLGVAVLK